MLVIPLEKSYIKVEIFQALKKIDKQCHINNDYIRNNCLVNEIKMYKNTLNIPSFHLNLKFY